MSAHVLLVQLGVVLTAGWIGGTLARLMRLPVMVGFLLAGLAIGPHTPGITASREVVENVANLGVVLLMFSVGLQFSLHELAEVRREAVGGGLLQIGSTILLGLGVSRLIGWDMKAGLFVGCAVALSSTAVVVRALEERGELGSVHGLIILGISVVQDLAVVAMAVLLPLLAVPGSGIEGFRALGLAMGRASLFIAGVLVLASRGIPWVLAQVSRLRSRELFTLAVLTLCVGAAMAADAAGLELALGAFLAGLVVAGSDYADEVLVQVRPLRDVFASVFFVAVGMLQDPVFVWERWSAVLSLVLAISLGKSLLAALSVYLMGRHARTSLQVGFGLGQIGEFSFVLVGIGVARGVVSTEIAGAVLASAVLTILLTPLVSALAVPLYERLASIGLLKPYREPLADSALVDMAEGCEASEAVVLGYGRVGRIVSDGLRRAGIPHTVVDYDSMAAHAADHQGLAVVYGDASSDAVLQRALTPCVSLVVIALPEAPTTEIAVRNIRQLRPDVTILARVHRSEDEQHILEAGADATIYAENLAGSEMLRLAMERLGRPLAREAIGR